MVANIIYYMIKYDCVAAINEGPANKLDNDLNMKYALIASPNRLYTPDYLLFSYVGRPDFNIKHSGLSDRAIELYQNLFGANIETIYNDEQSNYYTQIWETGSILSPYLMTNSHLLRNYFNIIYGTVDNLLTRDKYTH